MFIQLDDQGAPKHWPLNEVDVTALHPNTSFASPLPPEGCPDLGVSPLDEGHIPSLGRYEKLEETTPVLINNQWTRQWSIVAFSEEEKQLADDAASKKQRAERDRRLGYCDWTQLPDAPVNAADWATYRQALRDVTAQEGFPWEVVWPEQP